MKWLVEPTVHETLCILRCIYHQKCSSSIMKDNSYPLARFSRYLFVLGDLRPRRMEEADSHVKISLPISCTIASSEADLSIYINFQHR